MPNQPRRSRLIVPSRSEHAIRLFLAALTLFAISANAAEVIPATPSAYFNDYAGVVSKEAASRFNEQLAQFERDTSDQVVVAVFPKMQSDSDIADYTQRVAQAWGVGQKERRNGVVLFVFIEDRKMFIQVGYGLEGALPDATAFDITERHIKPLFRAGNYEAGLATGIDLICKAIRGEYKGSGKTVAERQGGGGVYRSFALHHFYHCADHHFAAIPKTGRLQLFIPRRWACVHPERRRLVVRWRQWRRDSAGSAVAAAVSAEAARDRAGDQMRTREFLSKLEHDRIIQAIREAESKTSGEIRVLIQRGKLKSDPLVAAQRKFHRLGMHKTRERNAVLIFVAPRVHKLAVVGDNAIHEKCGDEFWQRVVERMRTHFQNEKFSDALIEAVKEVGSVLARQFPKTVRDTNELPDDVIET